MDRVLSYIQERYQGSWEHVLDAGSGESSLGWLCQSPAQRWTAVTAEATRAHGLRQRWGKRFRPQDRLLVANWKDPELLAGECFDLVLADYLLGSCERVVPYFQSQLLERICERCRGWLFVVGLEPRAPEHPWMKELIALRDAVLLLCGHRPHRELPQSWLEHQLQRLGRRPQWSERFENHYGPDFVEREIGAVESNLAGLSDRGLAQVLRRRCHQLRAQAHEWLQEDGAISHSWDYVVAVSLVG